MIILSIIGKVLTTLAKLAVKLAKFCYEVAKKASKASKKALKRAYYKLRALLKRQIAEQFELQGIEKKIVGILISAFLFLMVPVMILQGAASFASSVRDYFLDLIGLGFFTEEEADYIVNDAGSLAELLKSQGYEKYSEYLSGIDVDTVVRILEAVDEWNTNAQKEVTVEYEYRLETAPAGTLPLMDEVTGEIIGDTDSLDDYDVEYDTLEKTVSRKNIEYMTSVDGVYEDIFRVRWQPVVALCCMKIISNSPNWGTYTIEDGQLSSGEPNYYLSDEEIDQIIRLFVYKYSYVKDITDGGSRSYDFEDFMEGRNSTGFILRTWLRISNVDGEEYHTRVTIREPSIAPYYIKNSYITYEYFYDKVNLEDGSAGRKLVCRTATVKPHQLVDDMKMLVPEFDEKWFMMLLEILPGSDDLVDYYESLIFAAPEDYEVMRETADSIAGCPVIGTYVHEGNYRGPLVEDPEGGMTIPLYSMDKNGKHIKPGEWIVEPGNNYGSYYVEFEAIRTLMRPDRKWDGSSTTINPFPDNPTTEIDIPAVYFDKEDITRMITTYPFTDEERKHCPLFSDVNVIAELIQCLWDFQEEKQCSVSALLAIMKQEGGFRNTNIAVNGWNFFNISARTTDFKIQGNERFRNFKAEYQEIVDGRYEHAVINAFAAQIEWIYKNYWTAGQDTFYSMCFNGYNVNDPEHAYDNLSHCYCPPWDDRAMPYSRDSYIYYDGGYIYHWKYATEANRGWVNGTAIIQRKFLECGMTGFEQVLDFDILEGGIIPATVIE